ncbi:MAG: PilZ domain-containing protein [Spirochaetales bacterium]|nr:PilZ domain-containing protein [Spirochaetales bacterium]
MAHEIKRIEKEFVFKTVSDEGAAVSVHVRTHRYRGVFDPVHGTKIILTMEEQLTKEVLPKRVTLFFFFRSTPMTCKCIVQSIEGQKIHLEMPDRVYRDLGRSYERVQPEGNIGVSVLLDGQSFKLDFPSSESYYEVTAPPSLDIDFNPAKIAQLIQGFRDKVATMGSENKIIMFRERKQETVAEKLITVSGKTLLLPFDSLRQFTDLHPKQRNLLITQDDLIRLFREIDMDPMTGVNTLRAYMEKRKSQKVWQEIYSPILYREYVVGYILLVRGDVHTGGVSPETLEFLIQFSRLLAYALKQNGYFKEIPVQAEFNNSDLIDISGSGMLFSYPLDGPELSLFMDIDIKVTTDPRNVPIRGRIMRIYRDSHNVYVGLQFLELNQEDHEFLLSYLYGADYDGKIEVNAPGFGEEEA